MQPQSGFIYHQVVQRVPCRIQKDAYQIPQAVSAVLQGPFRTRALLDVESGLPLPLPWPQHQAVSHLRECLAQPPEGFSIIAVWAVG